MKYTPELTKFLSDSYTSGKTVEEIADIINNTDPKSFNCEGPGCYGLGSEPIPIRSIIAKLSSLGVYKKKQYVTKRGEIPVKKEEYIERISKLLDVNSEMLESLEKVNKSVLALLEKKLTTQSE